MKLIKQGFRLNNYRKLITAFILSSLFSIDGDAFRYSLNFLDSKNEEESHFKIDIKAEIKEGFYMSSSAADKDKFQFQTDIEWPQSENIGRGCFDKKGNELVDDWHFPLYIDQDECVQNQGIWTYGYWIENLEEYYDAPLFEKISSLVESKKPQIKMDVPIQKGSLNIQQEYKLVDGLEDGIYILKGKFSYQVCDESNGICEPRYDNFSKRLDISSKNGSYSLVWDGN